MLGSVVLLSLYGPDHEVAQKRTTGTEAMLKLVFWAVLVTLLSSCQIMVSNWLKISRNVAGEVAGMFYMLVEGCIGTVCMVVTTLQGSGLHELSLGSRGMLVIAACFAYAGIVTANYSVSVGVSGIVIAIYNANCFVHVLLSAIFLRQTITAIQILGVLVLIVGAFFISVGDMVLARIRMRAPLQIQP